MSATESGPRNPHGLSGLVLVDLDPVWMLDGAGPTPETQDVQRVWERLVYVCEHVNGQRVDGLPVVPVDSLALRYLDGAAFRGGTWGLCGLYGTLCVEDVADWLRAQAARPVRLSDCIVWPADANPRSRPAQYYFPDLDYPERLHP
jgi:hypothetical protein